MSDRTDALQKLHTALVASRKDYAASLEDAEAKGLTPLIRDMIVLRTKHADQVASLIKTAGGTVDEPSAVVLVRNALGSIRSLVAGLTDNILPGLISGEERILKYYDEAIKLSAKSNLDALSKQRRAVESKIKEMKSRKSAA